MKANIEEKPEQSTIELGGGDRKEVIEGIRRTMRRGTERS